MSGTWLLQIKFCVCACVRACVRALCVRACVRACVRPSVRTCRGHNKVHGFKDNLTQLFSLRTEVPSETCCRYVQSQGHT